MNFNNYTLITKRVKNKDTLKLQIVKLSDKTYNLKKNHRVVDFLGTISKNKVTLFSVDIFRLIFWVSNNVKISPAAMKKLVDFKILK